jgi:LacI family repressor for deo operon, udp, cdd, tsx, nupC, and nupG
MKVISDMPKADSPNSGPKARTIDTLEAERPIARPTMADLARRAGVSTATVSRALTRPDQVNAKTRARIQEVAEDLGFRPNLVGRQLRVQDATSLLILVQDLKNPFYGEMIKGVESVARANRFSVMVGGTDGLEEVERLYSDQFLGRRVDGLIVLFGHPPAGISAKMAQHSPVVMVSEYDPALDLASVTIDNVHWADRAVSYLIERGHRKIAHVTGAMDRIISRERLAGYRRAMARIGASDPSAFEVEGDFTHAGGRRATHILMARPERPTAIFCASDEAAVGASLALRDLGLSVPEDVSLIGFDDIGLAEIAQPALTTIRQPRLEMGVAAAECVIDMIRNGTDKKTASQLDCTLIERESVRDLR